MVSVTLMKIVPPVHLIVAVEEVRSAIGSQGYATLLQESVRHPAEQVYAIERSKYPMSW